MNCRVTHYRSTNLQLLRETETDDCIQPKTSIMIRDVALEVEKRLTSFIFW